MGNTKGTIGILTGGGDVPGLNPAIRAITIRALQEGFKVTGIRKGWAGLVNMTRDRNPENADNFTELSEEIVNKAGRTGGTFLHTSHNNPLKVKKVDVPSHLAGKYKEDINDLTDEIIKNLDYLKIDFLIVIGGDDTLSYAVHLHEKGVKVIAIPKTMDNDVPGTDYCIGFSTCITRTIQMANLVRTSAGSHERLVVMEVFGRYAGFTAMLPTIAGVATRCVIPEHVFNIEHLTQLMIEDRLKNPSHYSIALVSEGAAYEGRIKPETLTDEMCSPLAYLTIGDEIAAKVKELAPKYNNGKTLNVISQELGYMVRGGEPDTLDSIVPIAYGNLALDLVIKGIHGRMVVLKNGNYGNTPIDVITSKRKRLDVKRFYDIEKLCPKYKSFEYQSLLIITGDNSI